MSSRRSRGKTYLPKPARGSLGQYSTKTSLDKRRSSLRKDVDQIGYTATMRDLNVRATMNKNSNPGVAKKMRQDMEYLRRQYRKSRGSRRSRQSRKK